MSCGSDDQRVFNSTGVLLTWVASGAFDACDAFRVLGFRSWPLGLWILCVASGVPGTSVASVVLGTSLVSGVPSIGLPSGSAGVF